MAGNVFSSIALSSSSGGSATLCVIALRYGSSYWRTDELTAGYVELTELTGVDFDFVQNCALYVI